ncbi:GreA/GreB family elongation factor [Lentzea sp. NPDC003310]|uniref:GreA/GreB family elongation factor n=1 Tax=Lentzea sp. NPDC003310 TaxID=3154447 RepID=UPI0033AB1AA9
MTSTTPRVWLTPQAHHRLRNELMTLLSPVRSRLGEEAGEPDFLGLRDREARIRRIKDLLTGAIVGEDPPDDGIAEPGMVLTVSFDDTGETETFLLGARGAEHGSIEVCSPDAPLGAAVNGARQGEQRTYRTPGGATIRVTLLRAVPYGQAREGGAAGDGAPVG